jgi:hypothetical protein
VQNDHARKNAGVGSVSSLSEIPSSQPEVIAIGRRATLLPAQTAKPHSKHVGAGALFAEKNDFLTLTSREEPFNVHCSDIK